MAAGPSKRGLGLLVLGVFMMSPFASAQGQRPLNLMPVPSSVQIGAGRLLVDSSFSVGITGYTEPRLDRAVERFLRQLSRQTAIPLAAKPGAAARPVLVIHTDHAGKEIQELGEDESYVLEVSATGAKLSAANAAWHIAWPANFSPIGGCLARGLCRSRRHHQRQAAFSLARADDRFRAPFRSARCAAKKYRRPGSGEDERFPLASFRKSRLSRREQEISEAAGNGLRRAVLHARRNPRPDRVCARPWHPRSA